MDVQDRDMSTLQRLVDRCQQTGRLSRVRLSALQSVMNHHLDGVAADMRIVVRRRPQKSKTVDKTKAVSVDGWMDWLSRQTAQRVTTAASDIIAEWLRSFVHSMNPTSMIHPGGVW